MDEHVKDKEVDPDYASHNIALKRAERLKEDNSHSVEKLKEILNEEFNKELSHRQKQIEHIEKQIHKTQKLLHLMRYVLINSYYNRKDLEYNGCEEISTISNSSYLFDQNRIHPALKKLLGKNKSAPDFNICRTARRNKLEQKTNVMVENLNDNNLRNFNPTVSKSFNQYDEENSGRSSAFERNRQKIKNRIIVGNISKWMPSCEDDNLTHKWMMYVRGPKESPDVSHFIEKVVFYLHPSYKPHDVVEVCEPPFHLSRRGWGEFPIRVQIHFLCNLNKPVDIVHNLKLDKTYSGRQTLGNESIIDLYLYDDKETDLVKSEELDASPEFDICQKRDVKKHEIVDFTDICEKPNTKIAGSSSALSLDSVPSFEHDYCTDEVKVENVVGSVKTELNGSFNVEHCYSYPSTHEFLNIIVKKEESELIEQEENALIYGLDESYSETNEDAIKKEPLYYRKTLVYTAKDPQTKNGTPTGIPGKSKVVGTKRKPQESIPKKLLSSKISPKTTKTSRLDRCESSEFQISLPRNHLNKPKFKNMGETLPYLFKRLPLISELAENFRYKSLYPFTAKSKSEYFSWNSSKQSSIEWGRAKVIKSIIDSEGIHECQKWSTKTIMIYGKSHGYTPKVNFSVFAKNTAEMKLINASFKTSIYLPLRPHNFEPAIDIENEIESPNEKRLRLSSIDISDPSLKTQCSYIREEALECGIVLKNELIDNDITFNGAERMVFEALKCLMDHLVRRSLNHAVKEGCYNGHTAEISSAHVQKALEDRKELEALAEFRHKQTKMKYFFQ